MRSIAKLFRKKQNEAMRSIGKLFRKKQNKNSASDILNEIDPSYFDPAEGQQQPISSVENGSDVVEPETGTLDPEESVTKSEIIFGLTRDLETTNKLLQEEAQRRQDIYKELQEANATIESERKKHQDECNRLRSSIKRLIKLAFGKKGEKLDNLLRKIPSEIKNILKEIEMPVESILKESNPTSGQGKKTQQAEAGINEGDGTGNGTPSNGTAPGAGQNENAGETPGNGTGDGTPGNGTAPGAGQNENAGETPSNGTGNGASGNGTAPGAGQNENVGGTPGDGTGNGAPGNGTAPGAGQNENAGGTPGNGTGNGTPDNGEGVKVDGPSDKKPKKKKGNPNLKRKIGFLLSYSSNLAYGINAMNLLLEDFKDLYIDSDDWEAFQKSVKDAYEAYAEGKSDSEVKQDFIAYLSTRYEVMTTLEYNPGFFFTQKTLTPIATNGQTTIQAHRVNRLLKASALSASVGAHIGYNKFRNGLPYNTLCDIFEKEGGTIPRSALSRWMIELGEKYLYVVQAAMLQVAKSRENLMCDETYAYAREKGILLPTCYFWGMRTTPMEKEHQVIVYLFDKNRYKLVPEFYLHDFEGNLLTDGYYGYIDLRLPDGKVVHCACWVHARRHVVEAIPLDYDANDLPKEIKWKIWAIQAAVIISEMFHHEQLFKDLSSEDRLAKRNQYMRPLIDQLFELSNKAKEHPHFDPKSDEGIAINYILQREKELRECLNDGNVELSTNILERCNIIVALVRKRAKIFDSVEGAKAAAAYFTMIETAEENGLNGEAYLEALFTLMPYILKEKKNEIDEYMKWSKAAEQRLKEAKARHKKNPNAKTEIDWKGIDPEPKLDFLEIVMPWSDCIKRLCQQLEDRRKMIVKNSTDFITMLNIQNGSVSKSGLEKILATDAAKQDPKLSDLDRIFQKMVKDDSFEWPQDPYYEGPIKNVSLEKGSIYAFFLEEEKKILLGNPNAKTTTPPSDDTEVSGPPSDDAEASDTISDDKDNVEAPGADSMESSIDYTKPGLPEGTQDGATASDKFPVFPEVMQPYNRDRLNVPGVVEKQDGAIVPDVGLTPSEPFNAPPESIPLGESSSNKKDLETCCPREGHQHVLIPHVGGDQPEAGFG